MNQLNRLYEAMLLSWNVVFDSEYALLLAMGGQEHPVKVDDKKVYLPTADNLEGMVIGKVFFHPGCESIMSKETEIFKVIRKLTCAKIYSTWQPIAQVLFAVAGKKSGKTLSDKMIELLEPFKNASKDTKDQLIELIKGVGITLDAKGIDNRLISFNMNKGGKDESDRHIYWTATPVYPYYNELSKFMLRNQNSNSDRLNFNGSTVTREALLLMMHLMEICFPSVTDPEMHSCYVVSPDAARLTAYLNSYVLVARGLNSLIGKHRKEFDSAGQYGIEVEWSVDLDELGSLKGLIPTLDYNNQNTNVSVEETQNNSVYSGVLSTTGNGNTTAVNQGKRPVVNPPIKPAPRGNEQHIGTDYIEINGLFEYRYLLPDGRERVVAINESGQLISENIRMPNFNNNAGIPNMGSNMNDPRVQALLMMALNNQNTGIPPLMGMGNGMAGFVRDPYTGQMVPTGQNNNSYGQPASSGWGEQQTNPMETIGGLNINNF